MIAARTLFGAPLEIELLAPPAQTRVDDSGVALTISTRGSFDAQRRFIDTLYSQQVMGAIGRSAIGLVVPPALADTAAKILGSCGCNRVNCFACNPPPTRKPSPGRVWIDPVADTLCIGNTQTWARVRREDLIFDRQGALKQIARLLDRFGVPTEALPGALPITRREIDTYRNGNDDSYRASRPDLAPPIRNFYKG